MSLRFIRLHSSLLLAFGTLLCSTTAHAQETPAPRFRAFSLRLGANLGSTIGPMVGLDYTVPQWSIGRGFVTRFTLESIFNSRKGSLQAAVDPIVYLTLDQVYQKPGAERQPYFGAGIGVYSGPFGNLTGSGLFGGIYRYEQRFGGKVFVGGDLSSTTGLEGGVHFTQGFTLTTHQLRLKF